MSSELRTYRLRTYRLTTAEHVRREPFRRFLEEAVEAHKHLPRASAPYIAAHAIDPIAGLFVATENKRLTTIALVVLPTSPLMLLPQIQFAYNRGTRRAATALGATVIEWLRDCGFDQALTLNLGGIDDRVYMRAFRRFGMPERMGSVVCFRLGVTAWAEQSAAVAAEPPISTEPPSIAPP